MKKILTTFIIFFLSVNYLSAQTQLSDSAKISIMTCGPWSEAVYSLFGHTAIWVQDDSTNVDTVFNYGFFDPSQPNFIYHFIRGETDYILGVTSYDQFISEYKFKGVEVTEQVLNLTQKETQDFWEALFVNSLPQNRGYRYNYLYDNCVTRPRDLTEKYIDGVINYAKDTRVQTFRDLLHECLNEYKWTKFGIDLLIGSEADVPVDLRAKMFLPSYMMEAFDNAMVVKNDTVSYSLVEQKSIILKPAIKSNNKGEWVILSPIVVAFVLLFVCILISIVQIGKINNSRFPLIFDTLLYGITGIGGLILFTLMFFSEHPATNPNWNFVWMNIFALIFAFLFWVKSLRQVVFIYHFINFAVLTLFILLWWLIPQEMPFATIPFSLCLLVRSGTYVLMFRKKHITSRKYSSVKYMQAGWGQ